MKKKILTAVLLVACMVFSVVLVTSCGGGDSDTDVFETAIENTSPEKITGNVSFYIAGVPCLEFDYTSTISADGKFTVEYEHTSFNDISSGGANDVQKVEKGTVTSDNLNDNITGIVTATALELDLGGDMEYAISSDGKLLSATVLAEDTEDVFGIDYAADVYFTLTQSNEKIVSMTLEYTLEGGEVVKAVCHYQ